MANARNWTGDFAGSFSQGTTEETLLLYLHAIGHFHPETVLDNHFLASLDIGVDAKWIEDRVGIIERRTTLPLDYLRQTRNQDCRAAAEAANTTATQMSAGAAQMALQRAGLEASQLGMIVSGGCSPEMQIPADASRIANAMGIGAICFDLQSACSSFASQIHFLNQMRPETLPDYVLVVNSETFTHTIDYNDRRQAVLFGDGASAAIVSSRVPAASVISDTTYGSDPAGQRYVTIPTGGHFAQEGHAVQTFAIKTTTDVVRGLQASLPPTETRRPVFIGHQANLRMLENVCKRTGIDLADHYSNVAYFGNAGAAGAPTVLSQNWDELRNTVIHMAVVGSGLAWGGMRITRD
jgi:3-oxoacyl-[acyl-carrier-protein] synthase-3